MNAKPVTEATILETLRQLPETRWPELLRIMQELADDEIANGHKRTLRGSDLIDSPLIGVWADRPECANPREFAAKLREQSNSPGTSDVLTWDEHYNHWHEAKATRQNADAFHRLQAARKRVAQNSPEDWLWLENTLANRDKKWFVALVFQHQPIPRRLFVAMMQAAVVDVDASTNKWFIIPCTGTFGYDVVMTELERLRMIGVASEDRFRQALYWLRSDMEYVRSTKQLK